ncbi:glucose-1-phosphate adenylyltransferase [Mariniblastus sp.]|nr:glucose-1-phosphate adenylyltransferase [Mariniblastus sp.]
MNDMMAVVLAGGKGSRLEPLTRDRAKPAVPFGGGYRIIDFALSNCLNSSLRKILLLTQYKAMSLDRHINTGWRQFFCSELGEFIDVLPPQQRIDEKWYQGTADAVYQNIYAIEQQRPDYVLILAGDHIYKMNYLKMLEYHQQMNADLTIAALEVNVEEAKGFGVMQVDEQNKIIGFDEKPAEPKTIPGSDDACLASMGIYIFSTRFLFEQLLQDANTPGSSHDFGKDIIPSVIDSSRVYAFPFRDENGKQDAYWRDVGTLDAYYEANMDLIAVDPMLNMYDQRWPIRTHQGGFPPPKFVFGSDSQNNNNRVGSAIDSIVCPGSIVSGGTVTRCVIGPEVRINSYAKVSDSILFDRVQVGKNAIVKNAIIDKGVIIPEDARIGLDPEHDRKRGFTVTESGLTVIGKYTSITNAKAPKPHFESTPVASNHKLSEKKPK